MRAMQKRDQAIQAAGVKIAKQRQQLRKRGT
jgi:hypothetical protein